MSRFPQLDTFFEYAMPETYADGRPVEPRNQHFTAEVMAIAEEQCREGGCTCEELQMMMRPYTDKQMFDEPGAVTALYIAHDDGCPMTEDNA